MTGPLPSCKCVHTGKLEMWHRGDRSQHLPRLTSDSHSTENGKVKSWSIFDIITYTNYMLQSMLNLRYESFLNKDYLFVCVVSR